MKGLLATLPCLYADDTSTLLSVTSKLSLNSESSAIETFMKGADGRNVTQMASLMQNLAESQLFGDGVTGEAASGEIKLDSDITEALKMIKDLLLGDIQKALKHEHGLDQHVVNELHKCWDECKVAKDQDQEQVDELWTIMQSSKTSHEVCREDVHAKYIDKVLKCNALDIWIDALDCPVCYKEECVVIHDPSSRKVGDMLQAHIAWASNSYAEWTVKHAACAQAVRVHEDADTKCDKTQGTFESGTCAHRQAVWTTCNVNQMACCKRCSIQFDAEVNRVECAEKDRKIDWSATKKIECYIDVLMASPTDEELQAKCKKDGKACINQWREDKYKSCEDVCVDIDFEAGDYYVVDGVNTTHRSDSSHGNRCTVHLDIHFPQMPSCVNCPPPIPGPCEEPFISTYYYEYDSVLPVPGLENAKECHPDQHLHWWAYSRAECRPCPALIGRTCGGDPSCYFGNQVRIFHTDKMGADAYLNIGEVTVNGGVSMSVTLSDSWAAPHLKDNCVDGDPNTFCHSKHTHGWWVAFNLDEPTCINTIEILNRHNCCQDRIVGAGISIVNQGTEIWRDSIDENKPKYSFDLLGANGVDGDNCGGLDGGNWNLVRHVPAGNAWHPATDQLRGTDVYGSPDGPLASSPWTTAFSSTPFTEFLFATGDCEHWLIATRESVLGWYANAARPIKMSSKSSSPHAARWYRRQGNKEDPWISTIDHGPAIGQGEIVYGEQSFGSTHANTVLSQHDGANVFIRNEGMVIVQR